MNRAAFIIPLIFAASSVEACVAIHNNEKRLACYDQRSGYASTNGVQAGKVETKKNNWTVDTDTSPMTDTQIVVLRTKAREQTTCRQFKGVSKTPLLVVMCSEGATSIHIMTNCHMTSHANYGEVEYRLDNLKPGAIHTQANTSGEALGLRTNSIPFIKKMFGKEKILMRFTPFQGGRQSATFDISGIEEVINPLRKECNW